MEKNKLLSSCFVVLLSIAMTGCRSFAEIRDKADAGDTEMQYKTGIMLIEGDDIVKNPEYAVEYLAMATKGKHFLAACRLVTMVIDEPCGDQSDDFIDGLKIVFESNPPQILAAKYPIILLPALGAAILGIPVYILTWGNCDIAFGSYNTAEYDAQLNIVKIMPEGFIKYAKYLDKNKHYDSAYRVCCSGVKYLNTEWYKDKNISRYLDELNSAKANYERMKQ